MELFFDTETSGLFDFKNPDYSKKTFPWVVQLGAVLANDGIAYAELNIIVKPNGRTISEEAQKVHNISTEEAEIYGVEEEIVCDIFLALAENADVLVAHNYNFDYHLMQGVAYRCKADENILGEANFYCTMKNTVELCKIPAKWNGFKWPKLIELHKHLFGEGFIGAHDAMYDIKATMKCYYELKKIGWIK